MDERYANCSGRAADDSIDLVFEQRQVGTGCESEGAGQPCAQERNEQPQASSNHLRHDCATRGPSGARFRAHGRVLGDSIQSLSCALSDTHSSTVTYTNGGRDATTAPGDGVRNFPGEQGDLKLPSAERDQRGDSLSL